MGIDKRALRALPAAFVSLSLVACTTTPTAISANPTKINELALCRSYTTTNDEAFRSQIYLELSRRSITPFQCGEKVRRENQALAAAAIIAVGAAAVAVCANNDCGGGGGGYRTGAEWDLFYNQYGQQVWACRDTSNGQFTYEYRCAGSARYDHW